jgi:hypothetical protein
MSRYFTEKIIRDIPKEYVVGRKYHTNWAKSRGMVWILRGYDLEKNLAFMETPKTQKTMVTHLDSLRDINRFCDIERIYED